MSSENRVTMVAPSAGFTSRVMARIAERERRQARQRVLLGAALLIAATIAGSVLIGWWLASWIAVMTRPASVAPAVLAFSSLCDGWARMFQATWIAVMVVARNVGEAPLLTYAFIVLAMTVLWTHVATGSFQRPITIRMGGSK